MKPITTEAMLADLSSSFPALWKRPLREFGKPGLEMARGEGVWTGQDTGHDMPDGSPIFNDLANGDDDYDGTVHLGFLAWLNARGWYCENYDGATYFLIPDLEAAP